MIGQMHIEKEASLPEYHFEIERFVAVIIPLNGRLFPKTEENRAGGWGEKPVSEQQHLGVMVLSPLAMVCTVSFRQLS
jgi:hypothetical protein